MEKLSVQFLSPHLWRWIVLLLPALALAFWTYYGILAPLSRPARWTLWGLRGAAFLLVLFALWQPVLTFVLHDSGKPGLAILTDRSASMGLPAGRETGRTETAGSTRAEAARQAEQALARELGDTYRLDWYALADQVRPWAPDSTAVPAGNTALGQALEDLLARGDSRPISGIVLLSDGVSTVGRDPVRMASASPVPIFTVAVGPTEPLRDVQIRRVRTNPTAYAGEPLPLQAILSSHGFASRKIRVEVKEKGIVRASKDVSILGDRGLEQEVNLEVRPTSPGLVLYDVSASGAQDSVPENDRRQVAVEVLERKTRVLVLAGRLDWDLSFLRRTLGADTTLEYSYLIQARPGDFRPWGEGRVRHLPASLAELREFAAVILMGVDERGVPATTLDPLSQFVRQGGGLLLIGGPGRPGGWTAAPSLAGILPGAVAPDPLPSARSLPVSVTPEGERHPATVVRENPGESASLWAQLPPLWRMGGTLQVKPGARALLEYRAPRASMPVLAVTFAERGKVAWLYGRGIWRWSFLPAGGSAPNDVYPQFLLGLTRWLAEPAVRDRFQVTPGHRVYQNGESVSFTASLWDPNYAPVAGAQVTIEIRPAADSTLARGQVRLDLLAGSEAGQYDGERGPLPPGAWEYEAVAREAGTGRELAHGDGRFWVEEMGPEYARTEVDREALEQIARQSGGAAVEVADLSGLSSRIPRSIHRQGRLREVDLWNHWLLFVSFVLVLSAEWFLRRRRGLA